MSVISSLAAASPGMVMIAVGTAAEKISGLNVARFAGAMERNPSAGVQFGLDAAHNGERLARGWKIGGAVLAVAGGAGYIAAHSKER